MSTLPNSSSRSIYNGLCFDFFMSIRGSFPNVQELEPRINTKNTKRSAMNAIGFRVVLNSWCSKENLYFFAALAALREIISRKAAKNAKIRQRRNYPKIFTPQD